MRRTRSWPFAEHSLTMAAVPVQLTTTQTMAHDLILLTKSVKPVIWITLSAMLAGGQFSRRMPRDRPREANTSLISVRDFLPRLGVLSNSTWYAVPDHQYSG